jgi:hypothetical protein
MKGDVLSESKHEERREESGLQGTAQKRRRMSGSWISLSRILKCRIDTSGGEGGGGGWPLQARAQSGLAISLILNLFSLYSVCYDRMSIVSVHKARSDDFIGLYSRSLLGHESFRYNFHSDGCSPSCERRVPWIMLLLSQYEGVTAAQ